MNRNKSNYLSLGILVAFIIGLTFFPSIARVCFWFDSSSDPLTEKKIARVELDRVYTLSSTNTFEKSLAILSQDYTIEKVGDSIHLTKKRDGYRIKLVFRVSHNDQLLAESMIVVMHLNDPLDKGYEVKTIFVFKRN